MATSTGLPLLRFVKLSGAGNDFIALAATDCDGVDLPGLARSLCTRALSLGADGLIIIAPEDGQAVRITFYNPDGSRAEMCGNGSRCAARYAIERGLVQPKPFRLLTDSGELPVIPQPDNRFEVVMPEPERPQFELLSIDVHGTLCAVHSVWVGVPHAVLLESDVAKASDDELIRLGRRLRYDEHFPAGTNVNFATPRADGTIRLRTYERGVENLTKACGTGSTATAWVANQLLGTGWPLSLQLDGGSVTIDQREGRLWLGGDARVIAEGTLGPDALVW